MPLLRAVMIATSSISLAAAFSAFAVSLNSVDTFEQVTLKGESAVQPAPLNNCDLPPEDVVPNEYIVYLVPDYSLEDHKRTVGAALPTDSIEVVQKLHSNAAVWYSAKLDVSSLDIIRSDTGVELVECDLFRRPF